MFNFLYAKFYLCEMILTFLYQNHKVLGNHNCYHIIILEEELSTKP